jgi:hypothetical protein
VVFRSPRFLGPVTVRCELLRRATLPPRGPTGPLAFRDDEGGVSAAGDIFVFMCPGDDRYFSSALQRTPPFDAEGLMKWTSKLHDHYNGFFGQVEPTPYGVFLRYNPVNSGGGTGFFRSFVATYAAGRGSDINDVKIALAHEMFHTFSPYIVDPPGKESSWFGEGLAMF